MTPYESLYKKLLSKKLFHANCCSYINTYINEIKIKRFSKTIFKISINSTILIGFNRKKFAIFST